MDWMDPVLSVEHVLFPEGVKVSPTELQWTGNQSGRASNLLNLSLLRVSDGTGPEIIGRLLESFRFPISSLKPGKYNCRGAQVVPLNAEASMRREIASQSMSQRKRSTDRVKHKKRRTYMGRR